MTMNSIIANNYASAAPVVGMGVTELCYSDRHAYTVVEVISPRTIIIQRDQVQRTDKNGMSDAQTYEYTCDPDGYKLTLTLRKDGHWRKAGTSLKDGNIFMLGARREYHDYSF